MQKIGHRGACGYAPENTLAAFQLAIDMGCPVVELDVHLIENQLLVIHDETLERTTDGQGLLTDHSFDYLRGLDAGEGQKIPTLNEVISLVDHRAEINIELKGPGTALPVSELLGKYCQQGWTPLEFQLSSFDHEELARASKDYRKGALFHRESAEYFNVTASLGAYSLNLSMRIVNEKVVAEAHKQGLKVFVYTVNEPADIEHMRELGVDAIFTNYPDRV